MFFQSLKHRKLRRISLKHASNGDFGTILGKRKKCHETQDISIFCMFAVCKKHAPKEHSGLQSCMEFRGFRANVSPLAQEIYIYNYMYIYKSNNPERPTKLLGTGPFGLENLDKKSPKCHWKLALLDPGLEIYQNYQIYPLVMSK